MDYFFDTPPADLDRIEGRQKVTGVAKYAAEYAVPGVCYGVLVNSAITNGKLISINTKAAEAAPGVVAVISHLNRPEVAGWGATTGSGPTRVEGREFRVFYNNEIYFDRQPIALVVADTFERATHAASLVSASYQKTKAETNIKTNLAKAVPPKRANNYKRGNEGALQVSPYKIEVEYTTPLQVHLPMEMHAATVVWDGPDKVTVYNKTQAAKMARQDIAKLFGLNPENVTVQSPFVGGAFGSSSRVWPQEVAALLGAKKTGRPMKVMLRREETFNMVGYRPASVQKLAIGAQADGTLTAIRHGAIGSTSSYEQFLERITDPSKALYACPNVTATYNLVPLDMSTPCWTRGPGETSGSFALESGLDELSYVLKMDPLQLRLKNFADKDPENGKPWSSNFLRECYEQGAEKFGWKGRKPAPKATRQGDWWVGSGMASGIYHANRSAATVSATLRPNGTLLVQTSMADTGPGSATVMTKIAAETMGINPRQVEFQWGSSTLPTAPGQFGSITTASTGSGVHDAVVALQEKMKAALIAKAGSTFSGVAAADITFANGAIGIKNKNGGLAYADAVKELGGAELKVTHESKPPPEKEAYSSYSYSVHFVEVAVHHTTGVVRVTRVVSAVDAGTVINPKTARSQVYGSVAWGIGIALMEEGVVDHRYGRYINNDLANYHVPVAADIPPIDVIFIDKPDPIIDPMGAKGLGEVGLIGLTAAIANAVYHATGKRVRDLPITADKLI